MGCGCNSNFDGGSYEDVLKGRLDISSDINKVTQFIESLNRSIGKGEAKEENIPTIRKFIEFAEMKKQVLGQKRVVSMQQGVVDANRNNPMFPLAEQESKLASAKEKLKTLETEYEELVNPSPKVSFFEKNKITLLAFAVGISVFIGYKMYVKYRR